MLKGKKLIIIVPLFLSVSVSLFTVPVVVKEDNSYFERLQPVESFSANNKFAVMFGDEMIVSLNRMSCKKQERERERKRSNS